MNPQIGILLHHFQGQRFSWGNADLQIAKFLWTGCMLRSLANLSQSMRCPVDVQIKTIPPGSTLDSAAIGRRRSSSHDHRDIPLWMRMGLHLSKRDKATMILWFWLCPDCLHNRQILISAHATISERDTQSAELRLQISCPDAKNQAP